MQGEKKIGHLLDGHHSSLPSVWFGNVELDRDNPKAKDDVGDENQILHADSFLTDRGSLSSRKPKKLACRRSSLGVHSRNLN